MGIWRLTLARNVVTAATAASALSRLIFDGVLASSCGPCPSKPGDMKVPNRPMMAISMPIVSSKAKAVPRPMAVSLRPCSTMA